MEEDGFEFLGELSPSPQSRVKTIQIAKDFLDENTRRRPLKVGSKPAGATCTLMFFALSRRPLKVGSKLTKPHLLSPNFALVAVPSKSGQN